ncbi:ras and ef-hand domain-containing protein [Anaeramoeba ignava]|uniref:Ras and ef-hand domain-containing protein n=1 Tax=Anaeramoeba ignava TaxID=1746090 RepID=A0A9Q0LR51_ANAIG|nr:ras and ef-hand domain-containing protein [Anaeramoeba ignava]
MEFDSNPHKIVLLGESGVGKTCLALRFCEGVDYNSPEPTIAVAFHSKTIKIEDKKIKIQLWDTAGQEIYRSLAPMYIRNAEAAIIVYDITKRETFEKISIWIDEMISLSSQNNVLIAIVGNKTDLHEFRSVSVEEGDDFGKQNHFLFFETSAKTGDGVDEVFLKIAQKLDFKTNENTSKKEEIIDDNNIETKPKKKCC